MILGMKPSSRDNEGKVVKGWLSRELKRGYQLGQTWYLVSSTWWRLWQDYVSDNVSCYEGLMLYPVSVLVARIERGKIQTGISAAGVF